MAMHDDVDVVGFHNAQIGFSLQGVGGAKQDILQVGGEHGAPPTIGQRSPGALFDDVFVILVHPHMGAVHNLHDFAVDIAGLDTILGPFFIEGRRCAL